MLCIGLLEKISTTTPMSLFGRTNLGGTVVPFGVGGAFSVTPLFSYISLNILVTLRYTEEVNMKSVTCEQCGQTAELDIDAEDYCAEAEWAYEHSECK